MSHVETEWVCADCCGEHMQEMVCLEITTDPTDAPEDCGYCCDPGCCGGQWIDHLGEAWCRKCDAPIPPTDLYGPYCICEKWTQDFRASQGIQDVGNT